MDLNRAAKDAELIKRFEERAAAKKLEKELARKAALKRATKKYLAKLKKERAPEIKAARLKAAKDKRAKEKLLAAAASDRKLLQKNNKEFTDEHNKKFPVSVATEKERIERFFKVIEGDKKITVNQKYRKHHRSWAVKNPK